MGYYAVSGGEVRLKNDVSQENLEKINSFLKSDFTQIGFHKIYPPESDDGCYMVELSGDEKFNEDFWYEFFARIKPYVCGGTIEFTGEDGIRWRYVYADGSWYEESIVDVIWGMAESLDDFVDNAWEEINEQTETD